MGTLGQIKRIFIVIVLIMIAIAGYTYWEDVKPTYERIADRFYAVEDALNKADEITDTVAGIKTERIFVVADSNEIAVDVEIADNDLEREKGLMYRENLCEDCGMLFKFPKDVQNGFWMKNCLIPLDILFISNEGKILDIKRDFRPCDQDECPTYSPDQPYRCVLEVNSGWSEKNGVETGDKVVGIKSGS